MTKEIEVHEKDTIAIEVELPRDLTGASVSFLFTEEEEEYAAEIKDENTGLVAVSLSTVDPEYGLHEIKWKVTFEDGTVEVLPPEGDNLSVKR